MVSRRDIFTISIPLATFLALPVPLQQAFTKGGKGKKMAEDWSQDVPDELFVGNLLAGFIDITDKIPAELTTFYTTNYGGNAVKAAVRFVSIVGTVTQYYYMILWNSPSALIWSMGWVDLNLQVHEGYHTEASLTEPAVFLGHVSPIRVVLGGDAGGLSELDIILSKIFVESSLNFDLASFAGDLLIDSVSMPRGLAYARQMSGNPVATSTAGAEVVVITLASFTYKSNRAYRVSLHGPANISTAGGSITYRLRRGTGTGGAQIIAWNVAHPGTSNQEDDVWGYVVNLSGSDIIQQVVLTMAASGTNNASFFATGAGQGQLLVEDIGDARAFTGGSTANW